MSQLALLGGNPVRQKPWARWPEFGEREQQALNEVLESGIWGGYHPKVAEFEQVFAQLHETQFGITAMNGTVTLETALHVLGIGPGDEVIVPSYTFIATATAVSRVGATPVFVDIDENSYNLDPALVEDTITERTRAIIPVHFAGHLADMDAFTALAEKHGLHLIEDAAHAHGSEWRGRKAGSFGVFGSFSFQQSKVLTAGEGGILISNDAERAEVARSFCNQGRSTGGAWYDHVRLGTNYRMTGWQAAILLAQLERLPQQLARRKANAAWLTEQLKQHELLLPPVIDERVTEHSYYLFMLRLNRERFPQLSREQVVKALQAEGMSCAPGYPYALYRHAMYQDTAHRLTPCPVSELACEEAFWLSSPMMLAEPSDLPDFLAAIEKVSANADALARYSV